MAFPRLQMAGGVLGYPIGLIIGRRANSYMDWIGSPPSLPFIPILLDQFQIQFINEQLQCWITLYHLMEYLPL